MQGQVFCPLSSLFTKLLTLHALVLAKPDTTKKKYGRSAVVLSEALFDTTLNG